jgi:hypothetical protein
VDLFAGARGRAPPPGDFCANTTNCALSYPYAIGGVQSRTCTSSLVEFFYLASFGGCVRFFSSAVGVLTVAGDCSSMTSSSIDGRGDAVRFNSLSSIVSTGPNGTGDLIVIDVCALRKISMSSFNASASNPKATVTVSTITGGIAQTSCGYKEGTGTGAKFASGEQSAQQLRRLSSGEIMLLDSRNSVIRLVSPITGTTTLLAGTYETYGIQDGPPNIGRFSSIRAATEDYQGSVYILDQGYAFNADMSAVGGRKFTLPCDATTHTLITCTHACTRTQPPLHTRSATASTPTPPVLRRIDLTTKHLTTILGTLVAPPGALPPSQNCTFAMSAAVLLNFLVSCHPPLRPPSHAQSFAVYGYANGGPAVAQLPGPKRAILDSLAGALYIVSRPHADRPRGRRPAPGLI